MNFEEFVLEFVAGVAEIEAAHHEALVQACEMVRDEAKDEFGHYMAAIGPVPATEPLADATKQDRLKRGFTEDDPLLRTGEIRDSLEWEVDGGRAAVVGSELDKALYNEIGTETIPARPILAGAAYRKADEIADLLGEATISHLF